MLSSLLSYVDRQVLAVLSPMILHDTGLSAQAYANALSAFSIFYMIGNPLFGSFLDFVGLRKGMFAAVSLRAIASTAHAWMSGFWGFAIARSVLGFGEGSAFPAALKAAAESLPPNRQSRGTAIGYSGASLGAIITPLIVTPIALRFGWRSAFLVTGAMGVCWLALWSIIGRPPYLAKHQRSSVQAAWPNFLERRLWLVVSSFGLGAVALGLVSYLSPLYLSRAFHLSQAQLGNILWIRCSAGKPDIFSGLDRRQVCYARPSAHRAVLYARDPRAAHRAGKPDRLLADRSRVVFLGHFYRGWIRGAVAARRLAPLSARSDGHGGRNRIGILVGRAGNHFAGLGSFLRSEMVWSGFLSAALFPALGTALWFWLSRPEKLWREARLRAEV